MELLLIALLAVLALAWRLARARRAGQRSEGGGDGAYAGNFNSTCDGGGGGD